MRIPPADAFSAEPESGAAARYWAPIPGTTYDLFVPGGDGWEPDAASLALAEEVLPQLEALLDEAIAHLRRYADLERLGLEGARPNPVAVYCDAPRERVEVSFNWEIQLYILWKVGFAWHGEGRRTPVEFSARPF